MQSDEERPVFRTAVPSATRHDQFDRLERLLVAMRIGEELRPCDAADVSGLAESMCRTVLQGLERAGLMAEKQPDVFVRRSLDFTAT
jgi:hypothetical protein